MTKIGPNDALARALTNDRAGRVSENDAKKIVASAVDEIKTSDDPVATFESNQRFIDAAKLLKGGDKDVPVVLDEYKERGLSAVNARLAQLTGGAILPVEAQAAFSDLAYGTELVPGGNVSFSQVKGSASEGFSFTWKGPGGETGTAHALSVDGGWFFSEQKITRAELDRATAHFMSYFDSEIAVELKDDWGMSAAEIADIRAQITPRRAYFAAESSDPHDLRSSYPLVLTFENPTGSDHGWFLGFNPQTDENEAYTFN